MPRSPRSPFEHTAEPRESAGVGSSAPPETTRTVPPCVVTRSRPSGVNARAVGAPTVATRASPKPGGSVAETEGKAARAERERTITLRRSNHERRVMEPPGRSVGRPRRGAASGGPKPSAERDFLDVHGQPPADFLEPLPLDRWNPRCGEDDERDAPGGQHPLRFPDSSPDHVSVQAAAHLV